jgi:hypothetical protein
VLEAVKMSVLPKVIEEAGSRVVVGLHRAPRPSEPEPGGSA